MACTRKNSLGAENGCKCSFKDCANWGKCCSCVAFHREKGEIPGCFFTPEGEKAADRSVNFFMKNAAGNRG